MDPQVQFCHNMKCPATGLVGRGNIIVHSQVEKRYQRTECGKTFASTSGTPFYRAQTDHNVMTVVLTLLSCGCPVTAVAGRGDKRGARLEVDYAPGGDGALLRPSPGHPGVRGWVVELCYGIPARVQ